jgi:hypothetical protein
VRRAWLHGHSSALLGRPTERLPVRRWHRLADEQTVLTLLASCLERCSSCWLYVSAPLHEGSRSQRRPTRGGNRSARSGGHDLWDHAALQVLLADGTLWIPGPEVWSTWAEGTGAAADTMAVIPCVANRGASTCTLVRRYFGPGSPRCPCRHAGEMRRRRRSSSPSRHRMVSRDLLAARYNGSKTQHSRPSRRCACCGAAVIDCLRTTSVAVRHTQRRMRLARRHTFAAALIGNPRVQRVQRAQRSWIHRRLGRDPEPLLDSTSDLSLQHIPSKT